MTREDDSDLSLAQRVEIARNSKSDLFISLHHNALPDARDPRLERGLSVHYYHATDRALAQHLLKELVRELNSSEHGLFWQNLHVLRENRYMPSILIEAGFLIHPLESDIISGEAYQESFVEGLVLALASFFDE